VTLPRLAAAAREWLGWCPQGHLAKAGTSREAAMDFRTGDPVLKNPGPHAAGGAAGPWDLRYEHTQRATVIIWSVAAVIAIILASMYFFGAVWVTLFVLCIMAVMLAICTTLTVAVDREILTLRYGPVGLIRKEWPLTGIVSATVVTNPWYYGYGIRWTPHGPLYNIAGPYAVEILLASGKKVRIGTDEPDALVQVIHRAIH
jgi:hypothetical protein